MRKTFFVVFALCLVPRLFAQSGPVQTASVTISSGQLQHMKAAPVQLVAAPGAGQMLNLISATMQYKAGATVYSVSSPGSLALWLGSAANGNKLTFIAASGFLDQLQDQIVTSSVGGIGPDTVAHMANQGIQANNDGGAEWTNGDGTVTITVYYTIVAVQ